MLFFIIYILIIALFIFSIKIRNFKSAFFSVFLFSAFSTVFFIIKEDGFFDIFSNCAAPIFGLLVIISIIMSILLTVLEKDMVFGLSLFPTLISGSILSDIIIVYILNEVFSIDSLILKSLGIIIFPVLLILSILILIVIYGTAIGFPLAICFMTKNLKLHNFLTVISSAVCSVLFVIAISHSGGFYLLADSISKALAL